MSRFGLGYPENYAKCREIAVYDYGTKLVFSFRERHFGTERPRIIFCPKNCTALYIRPSGTFERAKSLSPKFDGTRNVPSKNNTESRNGFSRDEERMESRNVFLRDSIPAIELK